MSGLIVRPGDTLVWSIAPPSLAGSESRMEMKRLIEDDLPGVNVIIVEGMAGGPFVYRPNPDPKHHPCCLELFGAPHKSWCPLNPLSLVDDDALPAANLPGGAL